MATYSQGFSRRAFVAGTSSFAALHSVANVLPLPPLLAALQNDSRLSQTVIADKGFASVRRVGNGLYATISDPLRDLLFSGSYPYCFDEQATVSGWRATLRTFSSWDKDPLFIPGHGQICGQDGVTALSNIFDDLAEQAEKMHKAGVPAEDAADQYVIPDNLKKFPAPVWGFTIGAAIKKLYAEQQFK
jgi:hypothetical protein